MSSKKTKVLYCIAGVATALLLVAIFLFQAFEDVGSDDPFAGVKPDYGPSLRKRFSQATSMQNEVNLGLTNFIASATEIKYPENTDWNFYALSVEKRIGNSSYIFFQRHVKLEEIPKRIIGKKAKELVTFNRDTNEVTFDLESQIFTYRIPEKAL